MGVELTGKIDPNVIVPRKMASPLRYGENVIKRERINYSVPQMVRYGMLPYSALEEYYQNKALERAAQTEAEESKHPQSASHGHTFWEDDDGEREMLSDEEYAKFLRDNAIDLNFTPPGMS